MKKITFQYCSLTAGWPNTYTFTKALAEDLAKHESIGLPFGIFRPSVGKLRVLLKYFILFIFNTFFKFKFNRSFQLFLLIMNLFAVGSTTFMGQLE